MNHHKIGRSNSLIFAGSSFSSPLFFKGHFPLATSASGSMLLPPSFLTGDFLPPFFASFLPPLSGETDLVGDRLAFPVLP